MAADERNSSGSSGAERMGQGWPKGPTRFERKFGNATTRVVIALVGIPLVLGAFYLGGWFTTLFVGLMSTGALLELYWMLEKLDIRPYKTIGIITGLLLLLTFAGSDMAWLAKFLYGGQLYPLDCNPEFYAEEVRQEMLLRYVPSLVPMLLVLSAIALLIRGLREDIGTALRNISATMFGMLYVSLGMATVLGVHHAVVDRFATLASRSESDFWMGNAAADPSYMQEAGLMMIMMMFAGIWACDSFAYFGGKAFGRHKLLERVSPKKTWEGAISGAIAAVGACIGMSYLVPGLSWVDGIVIGLIAGVLGQVGDLAESHVKRSCGVKDSSHIIPGHGGILDRFDSLLFVAPVVFIYLMFFVLR